ncbi:hypothetical protein [uncultured Acinetobacter sp.]|uniref:hypothetical protein n=1 Tax=uncultured Acinetobacter sp. TaxID=165433 RepID=UPI002632F7BE|nr:hypothetical protein [uncultured Acinetobacter sp.]
MNESRRCEVAFAFLWIFTGIMIIFFPLSLLNNPLALPYLFKSSYRFKAITFLQWVFYYLLIEESLQIGNYSIPLNCLLFIVCGVIVVMNNIAIKVSISFRPATDF